MTDPTSVATHGSKSERESEPGRWSRWFASREWAASLADLGTFLPLALGVSLACGLDLAVIFAGAGLMSISSAIVFRQPIPPQPMKAIAAIAIAGGIPAGAIAASGIWMGLLMLAIVLTGLVENVLKLVPKPVVIAIQVTVGCKLLLAASSAVFSGVGALGTGEPLPLLGWDSILIALAALALLVFGRKILLALPFVFLVGVVIAWASGELAGPLLSPAIPIPILVTINSQSWMTGLVDLAGVQFPLTLLNSVVAVCALSKRYFPDDPVPPRKMALGVAGMNLCLSPFGALPMCHGSGGLAAQHFFGARTGGAPIILGSLMLVTAVLFGPTLTNVLMAYPRSILAMMLVPAAIALIRFLFDARDRRSLAIIVPAVLVALFSNVLWGFLAGVILASTPRICKQLRISTGGVER